MLKKFVSTLGIRAFAAFINLAIAILLSQFLGPAGKGIQSIILTTISFILLFANFVGGATLVYLTPRFDTGKLLVPSYLWTILMSLFSFAVLKSFHLVDSQYIGHICLLSVINSVTSIHSNILLGKQQVKKSNLLVLYQSLFLVISLFVLLVGFNIRNIHAYIIALYISLTLCMIFSVVYSWKIVLEIRLLPYTEYKPVVVEMFRLGMQNQMAHITQLLSFRLSYYVLEEYKGASALGIFSNGISIAESIWLVAKSMALVQYSVISNSSDRDESARLTIQLASVCFFFSIILLVPLVLLPAGAYAWIFGTGFEGVKPVILTLAPGVAIYNLAIIFGHYFSGTGRYYRNTVVSSAGLAVSAILYFMIIPRYSVAGAGLATSISYIFTSLLFLWYFAKDYSNWWREIMPKRSEIHSVVSKLKSRF
ncbi:MAG TPA: polysaccharide biosynthesis C-terminal domain-containing protein [Bacteroidales bacterium]|nr:polysaccharide biosynthesis C-terminal domain-containing protein [Bacteroidales bacterium]